MYVLDPDESKNPRSIIWNGTTSENSSDFKLDNNTVACAEPWWGTGGVYWYHQWPSRPRCSYCDGLACKTPEQCPRVKSISYFKDGSISKIEFHKGEE